MFLGKEDQIIQFFLENDTIKGAILNASNIVKSAITAHSLGALETLILGQALCASALISTTIKGEDRLNLFIECGGPIGGLSCDINALGEVRGSLVNNPIIGDSSKTISIDNLYGPGFLHMRRISQGSKSPFTGSVELCYPDLASNLAYYYTTSEQTPTAFVLSVAINDKQQFLGASALLLQALPGAQDERLSSLQQEIIELSKRKGSLFSQIEECGDCGEWLTSYLQNYALSIIGLKSVRYACHCSKERVAPFLKGFSRERLLELASEDGSIDVSCHGCSSVHHFTKNEIDLFTGVLSADKQQL